MADIKRKVIKLIKNKIDGCIETNRERQRDRERKRAREMGGGSERERDRETERDRQRQTDRQTETERDREKQTDRDKTERLRGRATERKRLSGRATERKRLSGRGREDGQYTLDDNPTPAVIDLLLPYFCRFFQNTKVAERNPTKLTSQHRVTPLSCISSERSKTSPESN